MQTSYDISFNNSNEGLVISPSQLIRDMFYGVQLCTPNGQSLTEQTFTEAIKSAQDMIERLLNLRLKRQVIEEQKDFIQAEFQAWGMIKTTYPCRSAFELSGYVNTIRQILYPKEWLSVRKTNDNVSYRRSIYIIPNQSGVVGSSSVVVSGITPFLGFQNLPNIPHYWNAIYTTGFDRIPSDILQAIKYLASLPIYMILGNGVMKAGLSSQSISIDGLSQSTSMEAGGFTTRLRQLGEQLGDGTKPGLIKNLKDYYNSYTFAVA